MKLIKWKAIYILWIRDLKRVWRFKSELFGPVMTPLMFLVFLGFGLKGASLPGIPANVKYIDFIMAGVIGMTLLFNSMFGGMDILWDKEMGFMKEVMISPVPRIYIFIGRLAASSTISIIESFIILLLSMIMGFKFPSFPSMMLVLVFMLLTSFTFIGLGMAVASRMKSLQGFPIIMNFVIFPLFFLSGAFYPIGSLPKIIRPLCYLDPLTYGVEGMRFAFIKISGLPVLLSFAVLLIVCTIVILIGSYLFETSQDIGN